MQMWLTKGMFGEKIKLVAEETVNAKSVLDKLFIWKTDEENRKQYKIEKYDRMIFGEKQVAIDFGDYSWFMLITGDDTEKVAQEFNLVKEK